MWEYRAKLDIRTEDGTGVVDGDTIDVITDLGFGLNGLAMRLRLFGVNSPEKNEPIGWAAARDFTLNWLRDNQVDGWIVITTTVNTRDRDKADSFGRYLALVWKYPAKTAMLNQALIDSGNAVPYRVPKVWPPA